MSNTILIRGGRVIDPVQEIDALTDVALQDGKIARPGQVSAEVGGRSARRRRADRPRPA